METTGPAAVDAVLHASDRAGAAHPAGSDCGPHFAALDSLDADADADADGDEVGDRCIPTRDAWEWWRRAVELRASSSDCRTCEPAAYDAIRAARLPRNARRA